MKKLHLKVLVLILFVVALPLLANSFNELKRKIESALRNESMSSSDKSNLVRQLAQFPESDTVKFCFTLLQDRDRNADRLEREKRPHVVQLEKLQNELDDLNERIRRNNNTGTQQEFDRRNELIEKIKEVKEKIHWFDDRIISGSEMKNSVLFVLGKMTTDDARQEMLKGLSNRDWRIVYATVEGFGQQKWTGAVSEISKLYPVDGRPHRSDIVRASVLKALNSIDASGSKDIFIKALEDDNIVVRTSAVNSLAKVGDKDCILPLIERINKETGRLQFDIITILRNLTGRDFGDNVSNWRAWWAANKDKVELNKSDDNLRPPKDEGSHKTEATFYGIPLGTDTPIFIIDQSGSMLSAADENMARQQIEKWRQANPGKNEIPPILPPPGYSTKWEVLQIELIKAIKKLPNKKGKFNIVWYSTEVEVYSETMVVVDDKEKSRAEAAINARQANGLTNIYEALEKAFEIASGNTDKKTSQWTGRGDADIISDTFFFMTDGSPTNGPSTDVNVILAKVEEWNKDLNIRINSVGIGMCHEPFLRSLADKHNGTFVKHDIDPKLKK